MKLSNQNILFLTRTMKIGGTENVVLQLCEILNPIVNKIIVCSCGGVNVDKLVSMGIKHYKIPDIACKTPSVILQTCCQIGKIIKDENITVNHSHHRMASLYAEVVAPRCIMKIANAHNTFYDKKILTRIAYKNTKLIAVGEMVKSNLTGYFEIPDQQVTLIHNAVKEFNGNIQTIDVIKEERNLGHILIGNIGRLSEQKGMQYFIEAAEIVVKSHPETRFVIVGDGEEKEKLVKMVESNNMKEHFIFLGYRSDIQNVISQLDFIVLSSLWEGLPLTPIEAFSVGKTVIGTAVDGTSEIIRDDVDGYLVEPRNPEQIADKINYLIENPEIRMELEKQARQKYLDEFSFDKLAQSYVEFYQNL